FLAKFDARDGRLLYSTYLGGSGGAFSRDEVARAVAVADDGSFVVVGSTDSLDFMPPEANSYQADYAGGTDAFIASFNPTGQEVLYWSYLGGSGGDHGNAVAVDEERNATAGGTISSRELEGSEGVFQTSHGGGTYDGFVARFTQAGDLDRFSYLGGSGEQDAVNAIATDSTGATHLSGYTSSDLTGDREFPTTPDALQPKHAGGDSVLDSFYTKLGPGLEMVYSTCLGGQGTDSASGLAFWRGRTYVAGRTSSGDFLLRVPHQSDLNGSGDAFVSKFGRPWTRSLYVNVRSEDSLFEVGQDFGRLGTDGIVILDFGAPSWSGPRQSRLYGASLWTAFTPTYSPSATVDIDRLVKAFINGWWIGYVLHGRDLAPDARLTVAVGTTNCCTVNEDGMPREHGAAWAEMVSRLRSFTNEMRYSRVGIASALDAQLAWNDGKSTNDWIDAYDRWFGENGVAPVTLFDFGSCEGCHKCVYANGTVNPDCALGNWTIEQAWSKCRGTVYTFPIPEIYTQDGSNALQWSVLSRYAVEHAIRPGAIIFRGLLTECQSSVCPGPKGNPPDEGWWQLSSALGADPATSVSDIRWLTDIDWLSYWEPCFDC
ncbi:MAG: hypothetical protein MUO23_07160, partial [Anaerolineales bacterium]|nr:hypothetical protein [Anaerolineales bacterium]